MTVLAIGKVQFDACGKPTSRLFPVKVFDDELGNYIDVLWCSYCMERRGEYEWDGKALGR
jgi:hypothetical protein